MPNPATDSTRPSYMLAIVRALLASGGSARPKSVYSAIEANGERRFPALASDVDPRLHYENAVRFARQELADGGLLARTPGIWNLASAESARTLTAADAVKIIGENRRERERRRAAKMNVVRDGKGGMGDVPLLPEAKVRRRVPLPSTGPRPSRYEANFRREDGPASTYVFRFATSNIWKIGYAADVGVRLNHVNQHVPFEIVEKGWELVCSAPWPSQDIAYAMEQALFRLLAAERTMFERVSCDEARICAAWNGALAATAAELAAADDGSMDTAGESTAPATR